MFDGNCDEIELLAALEPLIAKLAVQLVPRNIELRKDLRQEGRIAAISAIRRWDPTISKLKTFAYPQIRGAMQRYLRDKDSPIKRPSKARYGQVPQVVQLHDEFVSDGGMLVAEAIAAEQVRVIMKFRKEFIEPFIEAIREYGSVEVASAVAGISKTTAFVWLQQGAAEDAPQEKREFLNAVREAQYQFAAKQLDFVKQDGDWRARTWLLERILPTLFGDKARAQGDASSPIHVVIKRGDADDQ